MDSYSESLYRTEGLEDTIGDREVAEPLGQPASPPVVTARPARALDLAGRSQRVDASLAGAFMRWLQWSGWN
jgi:hypothetical protein